MATSDHRPALNLLRGVAALLIAIYHLRYYADFAIIETAPWLAFANLGVDFFFILSGLIICHVHAPDFLRGAGDYRSFLLLRLSRLAPLHMLIMVAMLAAAVLAGRPLSGGDLMDWLTQTLLVRQLLLPDGYVWNTAAWSISAELFAYAAVFPALIAITRRLAPGLAAAMLLTAGWTGYMLLLAQHGILNAGSGSGPLLRVAAGFLTGAGLYQLLRGIPRAPAWDGLIVVGTGLVCYSALTLAMQIAIIPGLILIIAGAYLGTGPLVCVLARRAGYYLGEISFALYLIHIPLLKAGVHVTTASGIERGWIYGLGMTGLAIVAAALLHALIEVPARRMLRARWRLTPPDTRDHARPAAVVSTTLPTWSPASR